jgi:hypothetical protein
MQCYLNNRLARLVVVGVVLYAFFYPVTCWSGLASTFRQESKSHAGIQWPVIRNNVQDYLGLYGGVATVHTPEGGQESALLLILPTGYIVPLFGDGEIGTFPVTYFDKADCKGREYLPLFIPNAGLMPLRGLVYHSLALRGLVYIPKRRLSHQTKVLSRLSLNSDGLLVCDPFEDELLLYLVESNSADITGLDNESDLDLAVVEIEGNKSKLHQLKQRAAMAPDDDVTGIGLSDEDVYQQEECSPGCVVDALGNDACDIACYTEACSYDGGDCANVDKQELEQALSNICSPGCFRDDIGDGFCDSQCNTHACEYDAGDCEQSGVEGQQ